MAVLWNGGALGINFILMIVAVVSLTLAIINILPIPALDGGRLFVMLFSRKVLRHPLSQSSRRMGPWDRDDYHLNPFRINNYRRCQTFFLKLKS